MSAARARLALVVTTLGRVELLDRLMSSLRGQLVEGDAVVVVAQGNLAAVRRLATSYADLPIVVTTSDRGAALGRNVGVGLLPDGEYVLQFPNDSTWFPSGLLALIRSTVGCAEFRIGGMTVFDDIGPKYLLPARGTPLDRVNVWRVIEVGLLIRRADFEDLNGFDASIGSGAPTPWQSGEVTDLLLRALDRWPELGRQFAWLPPYVAVGGVREGFGLSKHERRNKLRAYGRGLGLLARRHHYPVAWKLKRLLGGAAVGLLRPREYRPLDGLWAFAGRLEGMLGTTIGGSTQHAVSR